MAKALAAMETGPSGATMIVLITWAPRMTMFWSHIGPVMPRAVLRLSRRGMKEPRSWMIFSSGERTETYQRTKRVVSSSESPVPQAAPTTPIPSL